MDAGRAFPGRIAGAVGLLAGVALPGVAVAVPGPDTVAVVANRTVPDSVALAQQYAAARQVPARQVCTVDVPDMDTIPLADYRTRLLEPLEQCLRTAGVIDRIEAVVLMRGIPLRVGIPVGTATHNVSLAAALGLWRSAREDDATPVLGQPPGREVSCGGSSRCLSAAWFNPFRSGPFAPGWTEVDGGIRWRPVLVTMLNARSYTLAARLITSATEAETMGGARGEFLFMNGADSARGVLDTQFDTVISRLRERGFTDVNRVPFNTNLTGHRLAAFFVGTASLGMTIEGNTCLPGSLVDNLTSYGAEPTNFHAMGESQVSIARWVAAGASGAHGTVDEPLNNVFPHRGLILDYVDGSTLAEAYLRNMPFVYWRSLVLGDPMLAPYAQRPVVTFEFLEAGTTVAGDRRVVVHARDPGMHGVDSLTLYVDGVQVAHEDGDRLETCLRLPPGDDRQVLAVAQVHDDASRTGLHRPKGWRLLSVRATAGSGSCDPAVDGGVDGGMLPTDGGTPVADAATPPSVDDPGGCGCHLGRTRGTASAALLLAAVALAGRRRRRQLQMP